MPLNMSEEEYKIYLLSLQKDMTLCAVKILRDEGLARDCIQESLYRLLQCRDRMTDVDNRRGYCLKVVRNCALEILRNQVYYSNIEDREYEVGSIDINYEKKDELKHILDLIEKLSPREKQLISLSGISGLSNEEITKVTGLTDQNVRTILSRARKALKILWKKRNGGGE